MTRRTARCGRRGHRAAAVRGIAPGQLDQHRVPVRRRVPADDAQIDATLVDRHAVLPRSRTTSRCTASTTSSTTSPTCAIPARAARTAPCSTGGCTGSRCGPRRCRACRSSSYLVVVGLAGVVARPGGEPVLRRLLQRAAAAAEGGAVRRLGHQQHPLLLPRRVRPRAGGRGLDLAARRGDRRVRAVGGRVARLRRGAGCRRRPRSRASRRSRRRAARAGPCGSRSRATPPPGS